ncbi:unnamed protein product [Camellia sinensis]
MTQKDKMFKGQQKKKSIPPSRHGKIPHTRKGKRFVKPLKVTKEMDADRLGEWHIEVMKIDVSDKTVERNHSEELSKFINHCNEVKAATVANKEGGQLSIVKAQPESTDGGK